MKKNVTLSLEENIYDKFQEYCKKEGFVVSRRFEIFMEQTLEEENE